MTAGRDVRLQVFVGFPGSANGVLSLDEAGRPRFAGRQDSDRAAEAGGGPNPYKGLEAFDERDAERFFGREAVVARLWESFRALHEPTPGTVPPTRLLAILGPSGCGKSSVARAGLIPELVKRPIAAFRAPRVAVLTPGAHPVEALAVVLARISAPTGKPGDEEERLEARLRNRSEQGHLEGLRRIADGLPEIDRSPLVVLVDQFEEAYSLCKDKEERDAFIGNLLCAAADIAGHVSVVVTLRSDFLGSTAHHPELNQVLARQNVIVPVMARDELTRAIAEPARRAGRPMDDATVALLVKEAEGHEGALPLLQFALSRIWEGMERGVAPAKTLEEIGGVGGALAKEATRLYEALPERDQRIARRAFLAMVQLGEGARDTRRRSSLDELMAAGEDPAHVVEVLPNARLPDRPWVGEAEASLYAAVVALRERAVLRGHEQEVWSAAFSPDGTRVVTGSEDRTARLWDAASGRELAVLRGHEKGVVSAAFSPDGARVMTASEDKTARLWRSPPAGRALIEYAKRALPKGFELTPEERKEYLLDLQEDR